MLVHVGDEQEFKNLTRGNVEKRILYFYSPSCGPCRALAPIMDQIAEENENVEILKINVYDCPNISVEYGIDTIPNLIYFTNGTKTGQSIGFMSKDEILENI